MSKGEGELGYKMLGKFWFSGNYVKKPRSVSVAITEAHLLLHSYHAPKLSKGNFPSAPVIVYGNQSESQRLLHGSCGLACSDSFSIAFGGLKNSVYVQSSFMKFILGFSALIFGGICLLEAPTFYYNTRPWDRLFPIQVYVEQASLWNRPCIRSKNEPGKPGLFTLASQ